MYVALNRLWHERQGNFALLSALLSLPLVLGVGMALDVNTIAHTRSKLQEALDSASLSIVREGVKLTEDGAYRIADDYLRSNFGARYSALSVSRFGTSVTVSANALADTSFGRLFGYDKWPVTRKSTAEIAYLPYEIALVLDTTGSMKGGKLAAMKDSVLGLIDTMSANVSNKQNLKFALVPFSNFVNVGPQFGPAFDRKGRVEKGTGAPWLDLKGDSKVAQVELKKGVSRFEVFHNLGQEWRGCVETRQPDAKVAYDVTDAPPDKKAESRFVPALGIDEPDGFGYSNSYIDSDVDPLDNTQLGSSKKLRKYGLVGNVMGLVDSDNSGPGSSDIDPEATTGWAPVSSGITTARGPNAGCDSKPIVPLSTDYPGLKAAVAALEASGNTNIMEGVMWGWRVLSPGEPFTEGAPGSARTKKIMIVLTDGSNTFGVRANKLGSSYTSFGFAVDQRLAPVGVGETGAGNAMNGKTLAACGNVKAAGIEMFTIRLEEPDKTTGLMLKDCASDASHFFDAPSRSQLDAVFGAIRDRITRVRVSS